MYKISLYRVRAEFGGPEEGGWWYEVGYLDRTIREFADLEGASKFYKRVRRLLEYRQRKYRIPKRYSVRLWENEVPDRYPDRVPGYC